MCVLKSTSPETDSIQTYGSACTAKLAEVMTNPFWKDVFKHLKKEFQENVCVENFVEFWWNAFTIIATF